MGTKKDWKYEKSCNGYQKGQKRKYTTTEELCFFSVKSLSVKTPEVSGVEFYHFQNLSLQLYTTVINQRCVECCRNACELI